MNNSGAALTKDIWTLAGKTHKVAPNLIIAGFGGLSDLGHHGLALLLELGVNQADAHVLCHLVNRNELASDGRHGHFAGLLGPAPITAQCMLTTVCTHLRYS